MKWFKLFVCQRKILLFLHNKAFFSLHSSVTEIKKVKIREQNVNFAGKRKSLNHFNIYLCLN
ncbi:MAG: hypothetical protein CVU01_04725 [Bacteroidetes bacterium HGW-Bacteroidetes-18]|nr:MAG: hypothetical protein CVU01_04725 [Bacteroidetes bacterium HGW-Bacteroidetes-18]